MVKRTKKHTRTWRSLYSAVKHGSVQEIQTLINQKADVNELDQEGCWPLVRAAFQNRPPEVLQLLVDAKADPNLRSGDIGTPGTSPYVWTEVLQFAKTRTVFTCSHFASALTWATLKKSAANAKILIDAKADVNFTYVNVDQGESSTTLFLAVQMGSPDIVKLLVEAKAVLHVLNRDAYTVLDVAERNGHHDIAKLLLDAGAPHGVWWRMQQACIHGRAEEVKLLLDAGYALHFHDTYSRMPLKLAVEHGRTDIAQMLIAARAQVNVPDTSLLLTSIHQNNVELVRSLVAAHADVNVCQWGYCPIVYSIQRGDLELTKSLIDARANVDLAPGWFDEGKTALHLAVERGDVDAARLLIDAKANTNPSVENRTPLARAAENGHLNMMKLLLDAKAAVDGGYGIALLCAVAKGHAEAAQILLNAKASLDIRDSLNRSPLILAISCGHAPVVSVLLAAKAALAPGYDNPLLVASRCGNTDIIKMLIDAKAPLETPLKEVNFTSSSPLLAAVTSQNIPAMQLLVEAKAATDIPGTEYGFELLSRAIPDGRQSQNDSVLRLLLDTHPSLASKQYSSRLLSIAYQRRNIPALQLLLERNALVDEATVGRVPIFYQAVSDHMTPVVKLMIDAKADLNLLVNNKSPLACAVVSGQIEMMKLLLDAKAPVDGGNGFPLLCATQKGNAEAVQILLDAKASLESLCQFGHLSTAILGGHTHILHMLVAAKASLVSPPDMDDPLTVAVKSGNTDIMKTLIDAKAPLEAAVGKCSPLLAAIDNHNLPVMRLLLEAKATTDIPGTNYAKALFSHALDMSMRSQSDNVLRLLLDANPSLASNPQSSRFLGPLYKQQRFSTVKLLLEKHASVDGATVDDVPILYRAVFDNRAPIVKLMIDAKANVNVRGLEWNDTPLILASLRRYRDIVELLLEAKATPDVTNCHGHTPLLYAVTARNRRGKKYPVDASIVQMLVDAKAPLEYDALSVTVRGREAAVLKILVAAKADLRVRDRQDEPLLMAALATKSASIIETLLTADPSLYEDCDSNGMTALMFAITKYDAPHDAHNVRMLLEHAWAHCAADSDDEPPAKRFKRTE